MRAPAFPSGNYIESSCRGQNPLRIDTHAILPSFPRLIGSAFRGDAGTCGIRRGSCGLVNRVRQILSQRRPETTVSRESLKPTTFMPPRGLLKEDHEQPAIRAITVSGSVLGVLHGIRGQVVVHNPRFISLLQATPNVRAFPINAWIDL